MINDSELPAETTLAQLETTWKARAQQQDNLQASLKAWQARLEEWEAQITLREKALSTTSSSATAGTSSP